MTTIEITGAWRKSTHSNGSGNCVEVGAGWRKATYSNGSGACVEVGQTPARVVAVRDTTDRGGPTLIVSPDTWRAFTARVRDDQAVRNLGWT